MRKHIVVVTGAGAGVGRAVATEFARGGHDVALLARDATRLDTAAAELRTLGVRALAITTRHRDAAWGLALVAVVAAGTWAVRRLAR